MIWHPFTPQLGHDAPLKIVSGEKEFLYDENGKSYIDAIASWWTVIHGHSHPKIVKAIQKQAERLDHVLLAGFTHENAESVVSLLLEYAQGDFSHVFFSDNGSTAVEVMLKLALQYWSNIGNTRRTKFICFAPAYHGDTVGSMSVAGRSLFNQRFSPLLFDAHICAYDGRDLEACLVKEKDNIAAIVIEPLIAAAGGMVFQSQHQLAQIVELAHRHGALVLFDEVFTAMGRTGAMFAYQKAGVKPDLVAVAKGLSGGALPIAATLVSKEIHDAFVSEDPSKTFYHGHTMTGNPIAAAAARASLEIFRENDTLEVVKDLEARMLSHWRKLEQIYEGRLLNVRVLGAVSAADLSTRDPGYQNAASLALRRHALASGVILRPLGNVIYVAPPYDISEAALKKVFDVIGAFLAGYEFP